MKRIIQNQRWWQRLQQRLRKWLEVKKLERDLRESRDFQRHCEKINCTILAELEEKHGTEIHQKIRHLKMTHGFLEIRPSDFVTEKRIEKSILNH